MGCDTAAGVKTVCLLPVCLVQPLLHVSHCVSAHCRGSGGLINNYSATAGYSCQLSQAQRPVGTPPHSRLTAFSPQDKHPRRKGYSETKPSALLCTVHTGCSSCQQLSFDFESITAAWRPPKTAQCCCIRTLDHARRHMLKHHGSLTIMRPQKVR